MTLTSIPVCPPVVFSHWGNLVKTLPKSACWAGDYNAVPPTESQEPAKSCLGLHPPSQFFPPHSMCAFSRSDSLWIPCSLHLLPPVFIIPLPVHLLILVLPPSFIFLTQDLSLWAGTGKKITERKTETEQQSTDVENREQHRPMGGLIRKLHWQRWFSGSYKMSQMRWRKHSWSIDTKTHQISLCALFVSHQ